MVLAFAVAPILVPAASAESNRFDTPRVRQSCFGPLDYCVKNFVKTGDRDYYDLCMLSEKICRAYRYDWKLMSARIKDAPAILNDCFPDESRSPR